MRLLIVCVLNLSACFLPQRGELPTDPVEGKKVREAAGPLVPAREPDWKPQAEERILWRRTPGGAWELFDALRDPPIYKGKMRELWQPKSDPVLGVANVEDVYPYPKAEDRPRIESGDYAACVIIDARFPNNRGTRLCRIDERVRDMLHMTDEDGRKLRLHASDCIRLGKPAP